MTTSDVSRMQESSLTRDWLYAARYYLGGRRGLIAAAFVVVAAGMALNWGWLVTAGIAPFILGALPCVVMCALGLCMHKGHGRGNSTSHMSGKDTD